MVNKCFSYWASIYNVVSCQLENHHGMTMAKNRKEAKERLTEELGRKGIIEKMIIKEG